MIPFTYAEASREFEFPQPEEYWPVIEFYLCGQNNAAWIAGACRPLAGRNPHEIPPLGYVRAVLGTGPILGPYALVAACADERFQLVHGGIQRGIKPSEPAADIPYVAQVLDGTDTASIAANDAAEELSDIVAMLQNGSDFPPLSPENEDMLMRAIERKRTPPANTETWARQLAASVSHLTD
jgi:hypothetical protein